MQTAIPVGEAHHIEVLLIDIDYDLTPSCPACDADAYVLGQLGSRVHFKCRWCGSQWSDKVGE